jgi:hypothetical protein
MQKTATTNVALCLLRVYYDNKKERGRREYGVASIKGGGNPEKGNANLEGGGC